MELAEIDDGIKNVRTDYFRRLSMHSQKRNKKIEELSDDSSDSDSEGEVQKNNKAPERARSKTDHAYSIPNNGKSHSEPTEIIMTKSCIPASKKDEGNLTNKNLKLLS